MGGSENTGDSVSVETPDTNIDVPTSGASGNPPATESQPQQDAGGTETSSES